MHLCLRREKEDDSRVLLLIDISPDFTQRELPRDGPLDHLAAARIPSASSTPRSTPQWFGVAVAVRRFEI
jgi:hypothetical protein